MIVVITGVAGAGKSTVGALLAQRLGWPYLEADEYHPSVNLQKMEGGVPLTEEDRDEWLDALGRAIRNVDDNAVVTCSCLRRSHRERLRVAADDVRIVYLQVDPATAKERVEWRADHFFDVGLVESQFQVLEEPGEDMPDEDILLDGRRPPDELVEELMARLR